MVESRQGPTKDTFTGTDPAAGIESTETIPTTDDWDLLGYLITIVTAIAVASRAPAIVIEDASGNEVMRFPNKTTIPASQTVVIHIGNYEVGNVPADTSTDQYHVIPTKLIELGPGYVVKTVTTLIQAADNYGAPKIIRKKYAAST